MRHRWILAAALLFFSGCSESSSPTAPTPKLPAPPTIQALIIAVPESVNAGQTVQLLAEALLSDGTRRAVAASSVSWQGSNPVVATISTTGVLSALQAGIVDVRGTYQQWTSATANVTVTWVSGAGYWDY